jgi:hypothetical protein
MSPRERAANRVRRELELAENRASYSRACLEVAEQDVTFFQSELTRLERQARPMTLGSP